MPLTFSVPVTPIMEGIINLHNYVMFYLIIILLFVLSMLIKILFSFSLRFMFPESSLDLRVRLFLLKNVKFNHHTKLEIIWTIIPAFILIAIAVPSLSLLYAMDEPLNSNITLKVTGHQWYWSYHWANSLELKNFQEYDSYLVTERDLKFGQLRLLTTDHPLYIPTKLNIKVLVTADDVLHSWSIPSFGIKIDCVPGRLNQVNMYIHRFGHYYGQCSELCGVGHAFMPIEVISFPNFILK